ncbi:hypothetical protein OW763_12755 [Clostridium aestuarii]|uniref:Tetratricopeptide repeat protein n=1 Tax=Clostridium aestuarii TaxID=338193 RepID=A0ABT4D1T5_9CLOT|nr:hypothetical protein [Clostridium aestuarii]MCY6485209.1 hypothetical protein [Clostridium aestuarii]
MNRKIRIILLTTYALVGMFFFITKINTGGMWLIVAATLIILADIKYASISAAFRSMKKNDINKTKKLLNETYKVEWLSKSFRGYYYMILAYVQTGEGELSEAVKSYNNALKNGLRTANDEAIIYFQLAVICMAINDTELVKQHLQKAKELKPKKLLVEKIEEAEKMLKKFELGNENMLVQYLKNQGFKL